MERKMLVNFNNKQSEYCDCTFTVSPGFAGSRIDPPEPPEVEFESIVICGTELDVSEFKIFDMTELEEQILEMLADERESDRADDASYRMENR